MALVSYVLGDCLSCGAKDSFGNVDVHSTYVSRGCRRCRYKERVDLPEVKKRMLYLDQFFFSSAFRAKDKRFVDAAARIARLVDLQLLVVPYSSIHEDETHQWEKHADLFKFIKATARGREFEPSYGVERAQLVKAFRVWLVGGPSQYNPEQSDVIEEDVDGWDSYVHFSVGGYSGDVTLSRALKEESIRESVGLFDGWRNLTSSFDDDVQAEHAVKAKSYIDFYIEYAARIAVGDFAAITDSPIASMMVESLLSELTDEVCGDGSLRKCAQFLVSEHFKAVPYQSISARIFATLKMMVKQGAHTNHECALQRLSGFFYDVKHVATYAPYVDAFVMDKAMAELVTKQTVSLEQQHGVKVFSLNTWPDFFGWLDGIESEGMTQEHKRGLADAYPFLKF